MDDDTEKYTSNVQTIKIAFVVISFVFTCIQIYLIRDIIENKKNNTEITLGYHICIGFVLFISMAVSYASASKIDMICGKFNLSIVAQAVLYPFIFVYLLGMATINLFPGKKKCFSVFFGNFIIGSFFGFKDVVQDLIDRHKKSNPGANQSSLNNISFILEHEPHVLFNELTSKYEYTQPEDNSEPVLSWDSFDVINNELKNITGSNLNSNPEFEHLKRYILFSVLIRDLVGESVWIIGLGLIAIQLGFNLLLSQNCSSLKQSQDDFEQYVEEKLK